MFMSKTTRKIFIFSMNFPRPNLANGMWGWGWLYFKRIGWKNDELWGWKLNGNFRCNKLKFLPTRGKSVICGLNWSIGPHSQSLRYCGYNWIIEIEMDGIGVELEILEIYTVYRWVRSDTVIKWLSRHFKPYLVHTHG